jgi:hypothetical protein
MEVYRVAPKRRSWSSHSHTYRRPALMRAAASSERSGQCSNSHLRRCRRQNPPSRAWAIAGCRKRQREAALLTSACRPAIAYSRVSTGRPPPAVPSSSNFPASYLGLEFGLIAQPYRACSFPPLGRPTRIAPPRLFYRAAPTAFASVSARPHLSFGSHAALRDVIPRGGFFACAS